MYAPAGESLIATYMLHCHPVTLPARSSYLGLLAGIAVAGALGTYRLGPAIGLKWPNDLLLNGKKAGEVAALPDMISLARDFGASLAAHALQSRTSTSSVISTWRRMDATSGRRYETTWNGATVTGTAEGIDDDGALLLRLDSGTQMAVISASSLCEIAS